MKRGRPRSSTPNRKLRAFRLSDEEYNTLRIAAARSNETWAAWLRRAALEAATKDT
jgi:hypothetical protein